MTEWAGAEGGLLLYLTQGAGARGANDFRHTSCERALPFSTSVPFWYCGQNPKCKVEVREWREVRGVAGRRAKRSARCVQEERSGHLSIENVSAEEEQKCAQQSA